MAETASYCIKKVWIHMVLNLSFPLSYSLRMMEIYIYIYFPIKSWYDHVFWKRSNSPHLQRHLSLNRQHPSPMVILTIQVFRSDSNFKINTNDSILFHHFHKITLNFSLNHAWSFWVVNSNQISSLITPKTIFLKPLSVKSYFSVLILHIWSCYTWICTPPQALSLSLFLLDC